MPALLDNCHFLLNVLTWKKLEQKALLYLYYRSFATILANNGSGSLVAHRNERRILRNTSFFVGFTLPISSNKTERKKNLQNSNKSYECAMGRSSSALNKSASCRPSRSGTAVPTAVYLEIRRCSPCFIKCTAMAITLAIPSVAGRLRRKCVGLSQWLFQTKKPTWCCFFKRACLIRYCAIFNKDPVALNASGFELCSLYQLEADPLV